MGRVGEWCHCCTRGFIRGVPDFHCVGCIVLKPIAENHSDHSAPSKKRTRLLSAVEAGATGAQAGAPGSQTAAPGTDAASSAIGHLPRPSLSNENAPCDVRVQVEAFGSGAALHGASTSPPTNPLAIYGSSCSPPSSYRRERAPYDCLEGHGGTESDNDDDTLLSGSLAGVDLDTTRWWCSGVPRDMYVRLYCALAGKHHTML